MPTPYSSNHCSNQSYFLSKGFRQMSSNSLSLEPVPSTSHTCSWCYSIEHPWKSTWCTCNLELQGNYPWGYPWLTRHKNQSVNAFFLCLLRGWALMLIDEAHQKICRTKQLSPTVRPIQEHSHVLAVSNFLINFSHSSPQHPEITFQINFLHTRPSLRLCFERNPS